MNVSDAIRRRLGELGDCLIPAGAGFPSASQANAHTTGLNEVIRVRPELEDFLSCTLDHIEGKGAVEALEWLRRERSADFSLLAEVIAASYFINSEVREKLGYKGQTPLPIDPHPDYQDDGLLQSVIDRGPVYRPTP